jgi:hypothetical protein
VVKFLGTVLDRGVDKRLLSDEAVLLRHVVFFLDRHLGVAFEAVGLDLRLLTHTLAALTDSGEHCDTFFEAVDRAPKS